MLPGVHFYDLPRVNRRGERVFRREIDVLMYYSDNELHQRYRFSRQTIRYITRLVADEISPATRDTVAGLDKSIVFRIIRRVTVGLSRKIDQCVKFPDTQEERDAIKQSLYEIANFPCAIDLSPFK